MVKMFLIKIDKNIAYYHCVPENNENKSFDIGIDVEKQEMVYNSLGKKDNYVSHAEWRIYDVYEETQCIPEMEISIWV